MLQANELLSRLTPEFVSSLADEEKTELLDLLEERELVLTQTKLFQLYPEAGPLRRELYPKHLNFFRAGVDQMERAAIAANRVGKTWGIGGYETALHLTGEYPGWWEGRRFDHPIDAWAAGDTSDTTRDIVQLSLFGQQGDMGTGLIPRANIIGEPTKRAGVAGAVDTARVRHKSGGTSIIGLKSYDQGRKKFQGTAKHVVWLDEEPPEPVYDECLLRLMTVDGMILGTFTPLEGLSRVVLRYLPHMAPGD
jgi:phage terminase large subunit-like protein